ncbi:DNA primase DnaG [Salinirubellus salinus]|uniref:DNA primase DnaG n=1 Tax=Salinirubellus salinus TaxID=1364945 RepID=A0A9E7U368_9EURY|nr:DNA primase DnaG [Salinirubellus salinus]UWM52920.1 DNA primase DnaG [Salinirubellus salinus]
MQDTAKYLIHADIETSGVVERNDVVGAIFGQTEGLLGEELEIRDLQDSSKVGRIDVEVTSENGRSTGELTIATSLDKVETAILAAALETIDRVGPCRSTISVRSIEDVRAAKRREVVERAKRLLAESFDGAVMSSDELVEEVRNAVRVADITEYEGYPAGPRVADSDAIIVVEGRADVLQLLKYGVKNAVAVEGTDVPEAVAGLTKERTVTAFLDGDRGGDLILKELAQVGDVDFVALAPPARSVEDLERHEVMAALREKVPYEVAVEAGEEAVTATDGSVRPAPEADAEEPTVTPETPAAPDEPVADESAEAADDEEAQAEAADEGEDAGESERADPDPETLGGHVRAVRESGTVRLLDGEFEELGSGNAESAFDLLREADPVPEVVVLDGTLEQRLLDVCAQRGVEQVVARATGEFVKQPASVRIRTFEGLLHPPEPDGAQA